MPGSPRLEKTTTSTVSDAVDLTQDDDESKNGSSNRYHFKGKTVLNKWTASYTSVAKNGRGRKEISICSRFMERKGRELIVVAITTDAIDEHTEPTFWY